MIFHTRELDSKIYTDAIHIRREVFVLEQEVPEELEFESEAACIHFVSYLAGLPVATVRLLPLSSELGKIQRMAVLSDYRGHYLGQTLMKEVELVAKNQGLATLQLGAQIQALPFYEKLGYNVISEEFLDANIPHKLMAKTLI